MPVNYKSVACPFGSCAAPVDELCQDWSVLQTAMVKRAWPHDSRLRLAESRHIEALENALRDAAGWTPSPFPPEIKAGWNRLLANQGDKS